MISGFNTDVEFDNVVYHVQTEDKGLKSRLIVSLVYDRGTILASKRSSYDDLANGTFDEGELAERVQKQHKLICAAVKAGRLNDLKKMSAGDGKPKPTEAPVSVPSIAPRPIAVVELQKTIRYIPPETADELILTDEDLELEIIEESPIFDAVTVVDEIPGEAVLEEAIVAPEAVAVVSELSGMERPTNTKLSIEVLGDTKFKGGDRRTVNIMVCRGSERKVINEAQIMVKVLGSSFRPLIFHAKTDNNGLAKVHLQLPHFEAGRAAVLFRAISSGEEIELRRIITPG